MKKYYEAYEERYKTIHKMGYSWAGDARINGVKNAEFSNYGYQIEGEITPVDMFPRTGHCEVVVSLTRNFASR